MVKIWHDTFTGGLSKAGGGITSEDAGKEEELEEDEPPVPRGVGMVEMVVLPLARSPAAFCLLFHRTLMQVLSIGGCHCLCQQLWVAFHNCCPLEAVHPMLQHLLEFVLRQRPQQNVLQAPSLSCLQFVALGQHSSGSPDQISILMGIH